NTMRGKYGETLVVDRRLAKARGRAGSVSDRSEERSLHPASSSGTDDTLPDQAIVTPGFMAPEQAAGRLDLFGPPAHIAGRGAGLAVDAAASDADGDSGGAGRGIRGGAGAAGNRKGTGTGGNCGPARRGHGTEAADEGGSGHDGVPKPDRKARVAEGVDKGPA